VRALLRLLTPAQVATALAATDANNNAALTLACASGKVEVCVCVIDACECD
jgi:hypothetical protein